MDGIPALTVTERESQLRVNGNLESSVKSDSRYKCRAGCAKVAGAGTGAIRIQETREIELVSQLYYSPYLDVFED